MTVSALLLRTRRDDRALVVAMALRATRVTKLDAFIAGQFGTRHVLFDSRVTCNARQVTHLDKWKLVAAPAVIAKRLMAFGNGSRIPGLLKFFGNCPDN